MGALPQLSCTTDWLCRVLQPAGSTQARRYSAGRPSHHPMAQLQQQCLGLAAALLLLLAAAATPAGAVGRHLRQAPAAAADGHAKAPAAEPAAALQTVATPATEQPSIYGSPETDACIQLTNSAGQGCTVESDTSAWGGRLTGALVCRGGGAIPINHPALGPTTCSVSRVSTRLGAAAHSRPNRDSNRKHEGNTAVASARGGRRSSARRHTALTSPAPAPAPLQAAAQPSASCCKDFKPYVAARCPCDP